ncbi:cyclase family protein [Zophobihabitans entericus]|uniref:Cyclase n=1 Tax=Zophobihabitans entericus TaxID=1635327 RepID=A0A6G9I996_9GAMM|nr:hypothetical protein [Zophobihabitans entericus]QIQ20795.1 hypothetical protein IPMB12_03300 [Zophobihabitans entericus]
MGKDGAEYLRDKDIKAVGTDAIAIDATEHGDHPAHYTLLGANIAIIENLTNLKQLTQPFIFLAFPLKIKQGSVSPIRAVAFIEK